MSRVLQCSTVVGRGSKCLKLFNFNEYILRREFHLRVLFQETSCSRFSTPVRFILGNRSNFHSTSIFASADDPQSKPQNEDDTPRESPRPTSGNSGETRGENIIERLRRLSMSSPEEYKLSPVAEEKAREMSKVRQEVRKRGEEWKWDQRNLRPGGPPNQNQYQKPFRMRNWDEEDNYDNEYRRPRDQGRYNNNRESHYQDEEEDYGRSRPQSRYGSNRPSFDEEDDDGGDYYRRPSRQQGRFGINRRSFDEADDDGGDYDRRPFRQQGRFSSNRRSLEDDEDYESDGRRSFNRRDYEGGGRGAFSRRLPPSEMDGEDDVPDGYEVEMQKLRIRMEKAKAEKKSLLEARGVTQQQKPQETTQDKKPQTSEEGSSGTSLLTYARYVSSDPDLSNAFKGLNISADSKIDSNSPEDKVNLDFAAYDPDTFGNLTIGNTSTFVKDSVGLAIQSELREEEEALSIHGEEEEDDARFIPPPGERWTSRKLIERTRELLKENKLKEAIDTYMGALSQGGFDFDHKELRHHFNVLIHECSKVGYVEMAFRLFKSMRDRKYEEKMQTYSSLLNACANSPWEKEQNLERIDKVLLRMKERGFTPNLITYHALIKAYGRLGETLRAFGVVDEMMKELDRKPTTETFNMLLQACITDKENGFRHALITWRKLISMQSKRRRPDIFTFNLLLRAVKDCGIELHIEGGSKLKLNSPKTNDPGSEQTPTPLLPPIVTDEDSNRLLSYLIEEKPSEEDSQLVLQSLGEPEIIDTKSLKKSLSQPENRLAVLGGVRGIISQMTNYRVGPNLKTVSLLLDCAKGVELADVMSVLKAYKIKADVDFYNIAIARCHNMRNYSMGKEFLKMLHLDGHTPNIVTYGALALGCRTWLEAKQLLQEMDDTKFTPNIAVMGSFLKTAIRNYDPLYILHVMKEIRRRELPLISDNLGMLQSFKTRTQRGIISKEMGKPVESGELAHALEKNPDLPEHFHIFKTQFEQWLETVDVKVEPENPWKEEYYHFMKEKKHMNYNEEDDIEKIVAEKLGAENKN